MDRNIGRMCSTLAPARIQDFSRIGSIVAALVAAVILPLAASAQEVDEAYIVNHLGPAAEEMQAAGVDGSPESSPVIIAIAQRWVIDPAYWVGVDEAEMLVRADREDRDARGRQAALTSPVEKYPSRIVLASFGILRVGLTCQQAQAKAQSAQRLADTLGRLSQLNGVGTGLIGVISQGAARFVGPMAVATMVTGFAATWAGQLAAGYRNAPCLTGGQQWRFRPNVLRASHFPGPFPAPRSSHGRHGWLSAALLTGTTSAPREAESPFLCRLASGRSHSL